ncbi:MAG TPA: ferrochelatase [Candidatus Sulfotelmatobacter sp.]|nr:ferrochelatase [Candidatus Sulfotelmatobacter sp.]
MSANRTAVLLMAYGSPDTLDDVEAYLTDIRGGRRPPPEAVEELKERYRQVGVPTPLLRISLEVTRGLESLLGEGYCVHLGMKHWTPRIATAVQAIVTEGADRLIAIVLAPHYSRMGTGGYRLQVERALRASRSDIRLDFVESWHDLDGYLETVAENVREELNQFSKPELVVGIFTAHSLPARIMDEGDPYQEQLLFSTREIARRAAVHRWEFAFTSQSRTGEPWLGPDLLDVLKRRASQGDRQFLVTSVGFTADHLEILHDVDIEAQETARELGIEVRRPKMLNSDPRFVHALAGLVLRRAATVPAAS